VDQYAGAVNRITNLEIKAGFLLLLGIATVCGIIVLFGMTPDFLKPTYEIIVQISDASGVTKGTDVTLYGAVIGKVASDPQTVPGTQKVDVKLKIDRDVKIRQDAQFSIESSGFFGDKIVNVKPENTRPGDDRTPYLHDGGIVQGVQAPDFSTLITGSLPLIHRANHVAAQIDDMVTRLNTDVLTKTSTDNLKDIGAKMQAIAADSNKVVANTNGLISDVKSGDGALGQLLYGKELRRNLADFMTNYKTHGLLFYSDDTAAPAKESPSRPSWRARP
jgi:phospholipid/cholesterol/gamma-HCH transport system substrate-binding protein